MEPRPTGPIWSGGMEARPRENRPRVSERSETTLLAASLGAMVGVGLAWVALVLAVFEAWSTW